MSEKVLFELRIHIGEDGTRIEVHESAEWQAYHGTGHNTDREPDHSASRPAYRADHPMNRGRDRLRAWALQCCCPNEGESAEAPSEPRQHTSRADNVRWALNSLQNIYDDLYGDASA